MSERIERAQRIVDQVIDGSWPVESVEAIGVGKGVFSSVERLVSAGSMPPSLVIKHADRGANGAAARDGGAYERERTAYVDLLPETPSVSTPHHHGSVDDDGYISFVLEDLSHLRSVDQVIGMGPTEAAAAVEQLIHLHASWCDRVGGIDVRRNTPTTLPVVGVERGLVSLDERWSDQLGAETVGPLRALAVHRDGPLAAFVDATRSAPTLCHGDARADNMVFRDDGTAVLFDWQQIAVQFGEADLAWLLATSLEPDTRRQIEADLVASYALARKQDAATTWHRYRAGMVLPGLAVLFLAQRVTSNDAATGFVAASLSRISAAVADLDVVNLRG